MRAPRKVVDSSRVTSREYLYHLPCEPSARKLEDFGSGWLAPETTVRTDGIVVGPPAFRQNPRFLERIEQLAIEKLGPHLAVERFEVAVLPGRARLDVEGLDPERLQPAAQRRGNDLGPVIRPTVLRHAVVHKECGHQQDHLLRPQA